jgi:hypothetical protein
MIKAYILEDDDLPAEMPLEAMTPEAERTRRFQPKAA